MADAIEEFFDELNRRGRDPLVEKVNATFRFDITHGRKSDHWLLEIAQRIVAELGIEYFFNIQLVGDHVIEINPRISTIVYQEDLNLPYLAVKSALGEISHEELAQLGARVRPSRRALRYFDQVEWDESSPADMQLPRRSRTPSSALE